MRTNCQYNFLILAVKYFSDLYISLKLRKTTEKAVKRFYDCCINLTPVEYSFLVRTTLVLIFFKTKTGKFAKLVKLDCCCCCCFFSSFFFFFFLFKQTSNQQMTLCLALPCFFEQHFFPLQISTNLFVKFVVCKLASWHQPRTVSHFSSIYFDNLGRHANGGLCFWG